MSFRKTVTTFAAATAMLAATAGAAFASPAQATGTVNVRTGPGTGYQKVDTLHAGEHVDVKQCQSGWCYVEHSGPDGWVSANFLTSGNPYPGNNYPGNNNGPNGSFSFGFDTDNGHFGFSFGNPPRYPNRPQPKACFYSGNNYTGKSFCMTAGQQRASFGPAWNDKISSVRVFGGASVTMCKHANFNGFCRTTSRNEPALGPWLNDEVSAVRVR